MIDPETRLKLARETYVAHMRETAKEAGVTVVQAAVLEISEGRRDSCHSIQIALAALDRGYALGVADRS